MAVKKIPKIKFDISQLKDAQIGIIDCEHLTNYNEVNATLMALYKQGVLFNTVLLSEVVAVEVLKKFKLNRYKCIFKDDYWMFIIKGVTHKFRENKLINNVGE